MKEQYVQRKVFPYLATVLNHSRFNGEGISYTAEVRGGSVKLVFDKEISGNYFHSKYETAKIIMAESQRR